MVTRTSTTRAAARSARSRTPEALPPQLDWRDAAAVAAWARDVHTQAQDGLAAGADATLAPGQRELGRKAARRIITEASGKLDALFRFAGVATKDGAA
jgi:hypothetical protein